MFPEMKSIMSPDLEYGLLPEAPDDCEVFIEIEIGPKGEEGADIFPFTAITPKAISGNSDKKWGRGYLITPTFSWSGVEESLGKLLMHCSGNDWNEISEKLSKELHWEFDNYKP